MDLNPQRKIPDGIDQPFPDQTVDIPAAIRARHQAERQAEQARRGKFDAKQAAADAKLQAAIERQNAKALKALEDNPEPVWQRIASWLA